MIIMTIITSTRTGLGSAKCKQQVTYIQGLHQHHLEDDLKDADDSTYSASTTTSSIGSTPLKKMPIIRTLRKRKKSAKQSKKKSKSVSKGRSTKPKSSSTSKSHGSPSKSKGGSPVEKCEVIVSKSKKSQKSKGLSYSRSSKGKGSTRQLGKTALTSHHLDSSIGCDLSSYFGYVVCGSNSCHFTSLVQRVFDLETATHAVRCCSDVTPSVGTSWVQSCSDYSGFDIWGTSSEAVGGRLCTISEIIGRCCCSPRMSGCNGSDFPEVIPIWVKELEIITPVPSPSPTWSKFGLVVCGSDQCSRPKEVRRVPLEEAKHPVRCCRDTNPIVGPNWMRKCDENAGYDIWGSSREINGKCYSEETTYS